jgi:hypothetical protein
VLVTDGPYLETKEHMGGFWILEAANLDEALAWGRKGVVACRAPVEVRAFLTIPQDADFEWWQKLNKIRQDSKDLRHAKSQCA